MSRPTKCSSSECNLFMWLLQLMMSFERCNEESTLTIMLSRLLSMESTEKNIAVAAVSKIQRESIIGSGSTRTMQRSKKKPSARMAATYRI